MRATDHRYATEMSRFHLAVRMIGHEARTGTIRSCTGFSEDRIRKIYGTYFKADANSTVKRRRGKTPTQITPFVSSANTQSEATTLACLFLLSGLISLDNEKGTLSIKEADPIVLGNRICDAYETYRCVQTEPSLCFEKAWGLYTAMVRNRELIFSYCADCSGPYVQDRYALDYQHCPFCHIKEGHT